MTTQLVCPSCGNQGAEGAEWERNAAAPFKLIEDVVRSWPFRQLQHDGALVIAADTSGDDVDWESGHDLRIECMQCFHSFPLPASASVVFDDQEGS